MKYTRRGGSFVVACALVHCRNGMLDMYITYTTSSSSYQFQRCDRIAKKKHRERKGRDGARPKRRTCGSRTTCRPSDARIQLLGAFWQVRMCLSKLRSLARQGEARRCASVFGRLLGTLTSLPTGQGTGATRSLDPHLGKLLSGIRWQSRSFAGCPFVEWEMGV